MEKRTLLKILFVLACFATAFAGATISYFNVYQNGDNAVVEWSTSSESNVQDFIVQRRTLQSGFVDVATVPTNSDHVYKYEDKSIYKTTDEFYIYRIAIVDFSQNVSYTNELRVSMNISGVKRTWGSIKAMFR